MLHGVVGHDELSSLPLLAHQDPDFYRSRAWVLSNQGGALAPENDPDWAFSGGEIWPRGELKNGQAEWTEEEKVDFANKNGKNGMRTRKFKNPKHKRSRRVAAKRKN